ncbi:hypothetical protein LB504_000707, partial [Fusarium proliferatum]
TIQDLKAPKTLGNGNVIPYYHCAESRSYLTPFCSQSRKTACVRCWPISLTHGQACTAPKHLITVGLVEPFRVVEIKGLSWTWTSKLGLGQF